MVGALVLRLPATLPAEVAAVSCICSDIQLLVLLRGLESCIAIQQASSFDSLCWLPNAHRYSSCGYSISESGVGTHISSSDRGSASSHSPCLSGRGCLWSTLRFLPGSSCGLLQMQLSGCVRPTTQLQIRLTRSRRIGYGTTACQALLCGIQHAFAGATTCNLGAEEPLSRE